MRTPVGTGAGIDAANVEAIVACHRRVARRSCRVLSGNRESKEGDGSSEGGEEVHGCDGV